MNVQKPKDAFTWVYRCSLCNDSGIVQARLIDGPDGIFAFKCTCLRGQESQRVYPKWVTASKKYVAIS